MYQGEHVKKRGKPTALLLAVVLLVGAVIGTTVALLLTQTAPVVNRFEYAEVTCTVVEEFDGTTKNEIKIQNTGNIDAYIRVALVANKIDESGNITGAADVPTFDLGSDWVKHTDEYYYYTKPVSPDKCTGNLLNGSMTLTENMQVIVLADAIQSVPAKAVGEAWGVTISNGTVKDYTASSEEAES